MASSFEKSVKGATKVKLAAPKSKYVEHILIATHAGEAGIAEVFRALNNRLKDQTWTIVFKSLIIVHLMIREGEKDVTLKYLRKNPRTIAVSHYTDVQEQGRNIRHYSQYLHERARAYGDVKTDYVRNGEGRLRKLSIDKGLLREVECVQQQIRSLLRCSFLDNEVDNEITLTAFRLLVMDLLVFFHVVNEGVINVLEHYFEMSRFDAERALEIYKTFTKQTADVVEYLQTARRLETSTRLQIPNLKHAPTSLTQSLEEYLHDPDFDINRRQYLAAQEAKKNGGKSSSTNVETEEKGALKQPFPSPKAPTQQPAGSSQAPTEGSTQHQPKVAPDLIDFFDSIETEQTTIFNNDMQQAQQQQQQQQQQFAIAQGQYPQPTFAQPSFVQSQQPFAPQMVDFGTFSLYNSGSFIQPIPTGGPPVLQPVRTDFTGHGFGGYTPQDQNSVSVPPMPTIPQQYQSESFQQPAIQQPFQHAPVQQFQIQQPQISPPSLTIPASQDTNPFRQSMMMTGSSPSSSSLAMSPSQPKSTNPFARAANAQQSANISGTSPLTSYPTGPVSSSPYNTSPTVQQPLRSVQTGTNPFARNLTSAPPPPVPSLPSSTVSNSASMLAVHPTGSTNPFRASMMQQQQQQQMNGKQTGTLPGWENIETIPVFPRNN